MSLQGYPRRMRVQRRLWGILPVSFRTNRVPCRLRRVLFHLINHYNIKFKLKHIN